MTVLTTGDTGRVDADRRRILDMALAELLRDPDASMAEIARAAGVVRRTVYGHFPSREALVGTLVDSAVAAVAAVHEAGRKGAEDPARAPAGSALAVREVADCCRILVAPVRESCEELLRRGLDEGVFVSPLPPPALAYVHEQLVFAVVEAVNDGLLTAEEAGRSAAVTVLTAAGVPASRATGLVAKLSC